MTLLYRTPNISFDGFEFHATVESYRGASPRRHYRWRRPGGMWRRVGDFDGHPPKMAVLNSKFATFKRHMQWAMQGGPV